MMPEMDVGPASNSAVEPGRIPAFAERHYLSSPGTGAPLRVGLLLNAFTLPQWQVRILEQLRAANFVDLCLVLRNAAGSEGATSRPSRRLPRPNWPVFLYNRYEAFDRSHFAPPAAMDPRRFVDATALLTDIPRVEVVPETRRFVHRFQEHDVEEVRRREIDVLLRWGFNILRGGILTAPRFGIWSYHHGDNDFYRGGPAGFWELYERNPVTGVLLQALSEELDGGLVLQKAFASTRCGISLQRNRFEQYWLGVPFVIRKLWELHVHGWQFLQDHSVENRFRGKQKLYRAPSNVATLRFVGRETAASIVRKIRSRVNRNIGHWQIALRRSASRLDPEGNGSDAFGFEWIRSPRGRFYADPFLARGNGRDWLFFEDFCYDTNMGRISCAEVGPENSLGAVEPVLTPGNHLSYPFVFEDNGEHYLLPEQGSTGRVDLYRAEDFPRGWRKVHTCFDGAPFVDVTPFKHDGLYWFLATAPGIYGARYELYLFFADSLFGKWRYHPCNPISRDIRNARSAGAIFEHRGRLIRPYQDCSVRYGGAVGFESIVRLNPMEYVVEPLGGITPEALRTSRPMLEGVHTYNRLNGIEVIDGIRDEPLSRIR